MQIHGDVILDRTSEALVGATINGTIHIDASGVLIKDCVVNGPAST